MSDDGGTDFLSAHPITLLVVAAVIGVPSLILYAIEVWVIVWARISTVSSQQRKRSGGRQFASAFYSLFVVRGVIAIIYYYNTSTI